MATHAPAAHGAAKTGLGRLDPIAGKKHRSLWNNAWRQFKHHRLAVAGLILLITFILATMVGSVIYPRDKDYIDFMQSSVGPFETWTYPLGTDTLGRDILARILWGGRISLAVGIISAMVAVGFGTIVGAIAGFSGGFIDSLLMRITDLFISLPTVPLLLLISFLFSERVEEVFDERFNNPELGIFLLIVLVISLLSWMPTARLVRASFLSIKEKEFVEAARSLGVGRPAIVFKHILPNALSPIIVAATLSVGSAIIFESTLSFLGLGFPSDIPTWGRMLFEAKDWLQLSPHEALVPGTVIFLTVLAINYIGDGLRDALDPRKSS
ncbi:MAG: ABC transporter permease [Chloroflexota bacterium]|nr:ABC transporter permease [Chloroflexota bacterium]